MFAAGMRPASTSDRYASDSAMPSVSQRGPPTMHALPPTEYCQVCTYSCAASSLRSVDAVQVSGAAAVGADHAVLLVTMLNDGPCAVQQNCSVPLPTVTFTVRGCVRSPPTLPRRYALARSTPSCTSAMSDAETAPVMR